MNKSNLFGSMFHNAGLDGILKPVYDKVQELTVFASNNRNQAIAKRQEAERLQSEAQALEADADRANGIAARIADDLQ